jgi:hypothetical protein
MTILHCELHSSLGTCLADGHLTRPDAEDSAEMPNKYASYRRLYPSTFDIYLQKCRQATQTNGGFETRPKAQGWLQHSVTPRIDFFDDGCVIFYNIYIVL